MTTTDEERAARIAAMRSRRGQPPTEVTTIAVTEAPARVPQPSSTPMVVSAPARAKHPHVAAGARVVATGLTASAVFGITTVLAAAAQPAGQTTVVPPQPAVAPLTVTQAVVDTTSPLVATMVVLTIPQLATTPAAQSATPATPAQPAQPTTATTPAASTASPPPTSPPVAATAPEVTAAPVPVPTQPPPPAATTAPSG